MTTMTSMTVPCNRSANLESTSSMTAVTSLTDRVHNTCVPPPMASYLVGIMQQKLKARPMWSEPIGRGLVYLRRELL